MYTRPAPRAVASGLVGACARLEPADRHIGRYPEFLSRHALEAKAAAQGDRSEREQFAATLLPRAGDTRNVKLAIEHCASRGRAAGPDGLKLHDLDNDEQWQLARALRDLITSGTYTPGPTKRVEISKGSGRGTRTIEIQDSIDRVVERSVTQVLQPFIDPWFLNTSFGFRPNRSREQALAMAEHLACTQDRWTWITEDLRDAFDNVPTGRLYQIARKMIPSEDLCSFIRRLTNKGNRGIRQGGSLSPLLLNIYLHWMLDKWWQQHFPEVPLLRVADDILVLARPDEAESLYEQLRHRAIGMPLKGNPRTSIRDMSTQSANWLGYQIHQGTDELSVSIGEGTWDRLRDHLYLAWEEESPSLTAIQTIEGWISQQGAAYQEGAIDVLHQRISEIAGYEGLEELPDISRMEYLWHRAYCRTWQRRGVGDVSTGDSPTGDTYVRGASLFMAVTDGSADRHCDFSTTLRRSGDERPSDVVPHADDTTRREVCIYTDGSYLSDRRVGGWAYLAIDVASGYRSQHCGAVQRTTNNRMELEAVIQALSRLDGSCQVSLYIDSQYVHRGITEWLPGWIANGWRSTGRRKKRISNIDLWQRLLPQLDRHVVRSAWVRGHSGHPENEYVDRLAQAAAGHFQT